jgi:hypothetical protein
MIKPFIKARGKKPFTCGERCAADGSCGAAKRRAIPAELQISPGINDQLTVGMLKVQALQTTTSAAGGRHRHRSHSADRDAWMIAETKGQGWVLLALRGAHLTESSRR